ncbi:uncharacterized protein [Lolium perenne]|uniref:uncharacterized protein isoform X2 n=1 Tax=Lolium perenne TaxID=4522 RepID=UPI0021F56468|nr:uncharacterized protein LOC127301240 isoform X2 [Lolium perenne]XP_051187419.1 uncharacterized protein LOC127301240 isoform X2 [Lolium perenne]
MEGLVPGNRVEQFRDQLKEGSVYTIARFDLYDPKKSYHMFSDRIDRNNVLPDIVGSVNKVTDILPPSGKAKSHKGQVYITDGSEHAIVTLWGEQADLFDADGFLEASSEEPVIVLFVGMTVSQYSGAFKSTSVTRWHVNVPIPEIAAARERFVFRLVSARKRSIAICCLFSNVRAVHMLPVKTFTMAYRATKRKPESR